MSPDECKKRQSGFWTHEYRVDKGEEIWRCDRHKLGEAVRTIMMDYREAAVFQQDPHRYLDTRFGEGTSYVYFNKHENDSPYCDYRTPRYMAMDLARERDPMAMASNYFSGNFTNTTTTSGTSGTSDSYYWMQEATRQRQRQQGAVTPKIGKGLGSYKAEGKKRLTRNLPFVCGSDDLLGALQREFDHWAKPSMERLYG
jgi:hypothetical protein